MKHFDKGTLSVILLTFIIFVTALFVKGFTQDLLIETGVFLVSVKLILMSYKNSQAYKEISNDLKEIRKRLDEMKF